MASLNSFERLMLINSKGSAEVVRKKEAAFRAFLDKLHENNDAILNETSISDVSSKAILDALKGYYAILGIDEKDTEFFKGKNLQALHKSILDNYLLILRENSQAFISSDALKKIEGNIASDASLLSEKESEIQDSVISRADYSGIDSQLEVKKRELFDEKEKQVKLDSYINNRMSAVERSDFMVNVLRRASVENHLDTCKEQIDSLSISISTLEAKKSEAATEIHSLDEKLTRLRQEADKLKQSLKITQEISELKTRVDTEKTSCATFDDGVALSKLLQSLTEKIAEYNKTVPQDQVISIQRSAKIRELSTGANVLGNLIIDQNTKDGWTGKIYTSMVDAKEIDANYDPNAVTISSVAVPGGQKESSAVYAELRGNERYIRSREFECNVPGSQGQPSRIEKHKGILVQESNGTVTNYSEKEVVENKAAMQETALRMAAMYLLNYPGTGAIKIKGGPLKMALAVHAAIANLLPNVEIKNYSAKKEDLETGFFKSKNEVLREKYLDTISQDLLKDMAAELKVIVDKTKEVQEKYQKTAKDFKGGTSLFCRKYDTADAAREAADAEKNATIQEGRKVLR